MEKEYHLAAATETNIISDIQSHLDEEKLTGISQDCYQRTSTPILDRRRCTLTKNCKKDGYEKWCDRLENSKSAFKVRGISRPLKDVISGNLIPFAKDEWDSDGYEENPANERLDCHNDTLKKLLLSVVSDHCKSLLKRTMSLVKKNEKTKISRCSLK